MPVNNEELLRLIERINNNTASDEDLKTYNSWCNSYQKKGLEVPDLNEIQSKMLQNINRRIDHKKNFHRLSYTIAVAASIILCISFGIYYLNQDNKKSVKDAHEHAFADIRPGGNKAFLTLADGSRISLTDAGNGNIATQPGVVISKASNGRLVYTLKESVKQSGSSEFNTISTPKGGRWQIRLPDGTMVWLNAASKLTYPVSFTSAAERKVELKGEAYFEVVSNKLKPFVVQSASQRVEVLGTHFNIRAYEDDNELRTTLLKGSVKVTANQMVRVIKPGEEALLKHNILKVNQADIDQAMAWKNGMFRFDQESLQDIMKKISRWYDVEIEYADKEVMELPFNGIITQFGNVSKVLRMLELTEQVHFMIKGKKILVLAGKQKTQ